MRILMTTDAIGGVWTFTQELSAGLLERGCSVALVSLGAFPNPDQQQWVAAMNTQWEECFFFRALDTPLEWMQTNHLAYTDASPHLLQIADAFKPDLLHSNQFCFAALPLSVPKVITAHSDVLSWAASCRNIPLEDSDWLRQYQSLVREPLKNANVVVAPTRWMLDALAENFQLPVERRVIPNGRTIPVQSAKPRKLQAVTAGRLWDEAKNISMLCSVTAALPLLLAGQPSTLAASGFQASGSVRHLGALSEQDLLALFSESAIYICPSRYEPFGLAPLEAALCGCAVLANDIPSLREVWHEDALYFSGADSLTQLLNSLCADRELLAAAQTRSHRRAQAFSRYAMTTAYLSLYSQMIASDKGRNHVA